MINGCRSMNPAMPYNTHLSLIKKVSVISGSRAYNRLIRLAKDLLLSNIPTSVITLPFAMEGDYTPRDFEVFSKSKGLMIFIMSDTDVAHEYMNMVKRFIYMYI